MVVVNTLVETSREPKVRSELRKHNKYRRQRTTHIWNCI